MSGGLISGLEKAARRPYSGWKTNNVGQNCSSPENDDVCLLDDDNEAFDQQDSPSSSDKRCLSEGHRSPKEFRAVQTSYKIPKKVVASLDGKLKTDSEWFKSSFGESNASTPGKYESVKRCGNQSWTNSNQNTRRKSPSFDERIGYRIQRQGSQLTVRVKNDTTCSAINTGWKVNSPSISGQSLKNGDKPLNVRQSSSSPKSRWKYADVPGTYSSLRKTTCRSWEELDSCQESSTRNGGRINDSKDSDTVKMNGEKKVSSKLELEKKQNLSVLDSIMEGNSVDILETVDLDEDNSKVADNTASSDSNCETEAKKGDDAASESSDQLFSDNNYDDCLTDTCWKCLKKFPKEKKGRLCSKCTSPSRAATPRKPLSKERFYSLNQSKVKRTYVTRSHENHTPVLLSGSSVTSDGECQTNCKIKKKKTQGTPKRGKKSMSDDSDSDYKPQQKRQCKGLQQTKPVVITLSDEEEDEMEEETVPLEVEPLNSPVTDSSEPSVASVPETPLSPDVDVRQDYVEAESLSSESCSEKPSKKKVAKTSKEKQSSTKKTSEKVHGYERDNLDIEIMLGQRASIGTLACISTEPLKITCEDDSIKLNFEYGKINLPITISGRDLEYFKVSSGASPDIIVLGVTSGFALKLRNRIHTKGKFFDPGSAVAAEKDIVVEVSECVKPEVVADIMEWVKDKLSKEFVELSPKEVERILSCKTSGSPTGKHNQSSEEEVTTSVKVYNTRTHSNKQQATVVAKRLIVYPPPPQQDGITVTTEDVACLAAGEFLNDVIIDFYLKYVFYEKLKPEDRERTHILSSFFYKRLTQRNTNSSEGVSLSPSERLYANVRTWTKNVEIFDKDFVVVPINESSHWYLAVICFAGHDGPSSVNEITDEDEETESQDINVETENETEKDGSEDDDDFEDCSLASIKNKQAKKMSGKNAGKESIKSRPCILVFDSLGTKRTRCMVNLRNYLTCEWKERRKDEKPREFSTDSIKGYFPKVPRQDNFCDCGVFVLQYMESFFEDAITDFMRPIQKPHWFSLEKIAQKRNNIRDLIYKLKKTADLEDA